jgi:hypothetical protein
MCNDFLINVFGMSWDPSNDDHGSSSRDDLVKGSKCLLSPGNQLSPPGPGSRRFKIPRSTSRETTQTATKKSFAQFLLRTVRTGFHYLSHAASRIPLRRRKVNNLNSTTPSHNNHPEDQRYEGIQEMLHFQLAQTTM